MDLDRIAQSAGANDRPHPSFVTRSTLRGQRSSNGRPYRSGSELGLAIAIPVGPRLTQNRSVHGIP